MYKKVVAVYRTFLSLLTVHLLCKICMMATGSAPLPQFFERGFLYGSAMHAPYSSAASAGICSVLPCVAVCCRVCCSVLQCVAVCCRVCCSVLQCAVGCVAVCCSVLQCAVECVAVCRSVLQCVAACCRVCCSGVAVCYRGCFRVS